MTDDLIREKPLNGFQGAGAFLVLLAYLALLAGGVAAVIFGAIELEANTGDGLLLILGIVLILISSILFSGVSVISPGHTKVVQFFGKYIGTIRSTGLVIIPPFTNGSKVSVRVRNFETHDLKVNDSDGNPINIAAIIVWQVSDTARATFAVENYEEFIATQSEAALRHVATSHPYDDKVAGETSLRGSTALVSEELSREVAERVDTAGIDIIEVRISSLAYAPEIAQAMLQRQQAGAIISARELIVEGAVTMVNQALTRLEDEDIVTLDDERKAQMVSNLLVVLCSDSRATPVVNAGSLYA